MSRVRVLFRWWSNTLAMSLGKQWWTADRRSMTEADKALTDTLNSKWTSCPSTSSLWTRGLVLPMSARSKWLKTHWPRLASKPHTLLKCSLTHELQRWICTNLSNCRFAHWPTLQRPDLEESLRLGRCYSKLSLQFVLRRKRDNYRARN